jgi:hypothetical protein
MDFKDSFAIIEPCSPKPNSSSKNNGNVIVYRTNTGKKIQSNTHRHIPPLTVELKPIPNETTHITRKRELDPQDPMYHQLKKKSLIPKFEKEFPNNRFDIVPGYRWDGMNRSNGFEGSYLEGHHVENIVEDFNDNLDTLEDF